MKMKTILLLVSLVILSGCSSVPSKVEVQKVQVMIPVPCSTQIPPEPVFNVDSLKSSDDIFIKVKSLLADNELHKGYELRLNAALLSCVK